MRIKQISVTKLFGIFDHVIPLNLDERITIIHGINGVGKTSVLKIINGIFNSKYSDIRNIPFHCFQIDFDDTNNILISKSDTENNQKNSIEVVFENNNIGTKERFDFKILQVDVSNLRGYSLSSLVEDLVPDIKKISPREWLYLPDGEILSLEEVLERFGHLLPIPIKNSIKKEPMWFKDLRESLSIRFIQSQRLLRFSDTFRSESIRSRSPQMELSIVKYSSDLAENIKSELAEYGKFSQSLDRTFPKRLIESTSIEKLTDEQLKDRLNKLEEKRHRLIKVGLLEQERDSYFQITDNLDDTSRKVLSVYADDTDKKLNMFSKFAQKIEVFQRIVNQRFNYKTLVIDQNSGFIFKTDQDKVVSPIDLSSGEQHELVMLYELLFKVKPGSLILIDEPEISLHVGWQVKFLEDLQEIAKLANIDILLATHSPDIINGRWDLTVELKGLSNERVHSTKS